MSTLVQGLGDADLRKESDNDVVMSVDRTDAMDDDSTVDDDAMSVDSSDTSDDDSSGDESSSYEFFSFPSNTATSFESVVVSNNAFPDSDTAGDGGNAMLEYLKNKEALTPFASVAPNALDVAQAAAERNLGTIRTRIAREKFIAERDKFMKNMPDVARTHRLEKARLDAMSALRHSVAETAVYYQQEATEQELQDVDMEHEAARMALYSTNVSTEQELQDVDMEHEAARMALYSTNVSTVNRYTEEGDWSDESDSGDDDDEFSTRADNYSSHSHPAMDTGQERAISRKTMYNIGGRSEDPAAGKSYEKFVTRADKYSYSSRGRSFADYVELVHVDDGEDSAAALKDYADRDLSFGSIVKAVKSVAQKAKTIVSGSIKGAKEALADSKKKDKNGSESGADSKNRESAFHTRANLEFNPDADYLVSRSQTPRTRPSHQLTATQIESVPPELPSVFVDAIRRPQSVIGKSSKSSGATLYHSRKVFLRLSGNAPAAAIRVDKTVSMGAGTDVVCRSHFDGQKYTGILTAFKLQEQAVRLGDHFCTPSVDSRTCVPLNYSMCVLLANSDKGLHLQGKIFLSGHQATVPGAANRTRLCWARAYISEDIGLYVIAEIEPVKDVLVAMYGLVVYKADLDKATNAEAELVQWADDAGAIGNFAVAARNCKCVDAFGNAAQCSTCGCDSCPGGECECGLGCSERDASFGSTLRGLANRVMLQTSVKCTLFEVANARGVLPGEIVRMLQEFEMLQARDSQDKLAEQVEYFMKGVQSYENKPFVQNLSVGAPYSIGHGSVRKLLPNNSSNRLSAVPAPHTASAVNFKVLINDLGTGAGHSYSGISVPLEPSLEAHSLCTSNEKTDAPSTRNLAPSELGVEVRLGEVDRVKLSERNDSFPLSQRRFTLYLHKSALAAQSAIVTGKPTFFVSQASGKQTSLGDRAIYLILPFNGKGFDGIWMLYK